MFCPEARWGGFVCRKELVSEVQIEVAVEIIYTFHILTVLIILEFAL